jgi:D-Tyr-tRNAtyr deacylase
MTSTNLESHLDALASQIALCQQGEIAEPNTWIERFGVTKSNGKRYWYFRLMSATAKRSKTGKIQGRFKCYLGSARSAKYKAAKAAIERRNHLRHLQKQYQRLLTAQKQAKGKSSLVSGGSADTKKGNSRPPLTHDQNGDELLAQLQQRLQAMSEQYEALVTAFQQQQSIWEARLRELEGLLGARSIAHA